MGDRSAIETLVLGVGNLLLSDEGAGLRVVERLVTTHQIPEEVQALDGGILGLDSFTIWRAQRDGLSRTC
jgi:hydrogenase maturation protease